MNIRFPKPPGERPLAGHAPDFLKEAYRRMVLIRRFELAVNDLFLKGLMPGTIHLSHGQEASAVGSCLALRTDDVITCTHRGHGQALAKGVSPRSMMAELFGRRTGCCKGMGGSLHVGDISVGALPAISIVAAASPIAAGMAYAFKRHGQDRVALNFFGDGAVNEGDWHEAMNLAAVWKLPVVFLCENNLYGVSTHITDTTLNDVLAERAAAYRMPAATVYGNCPLEVHAAASAAVERARTGGGPTMVECLTYRRGGHKRDDAATYRPKDEVEAWLAADPVTTFAARLAADPRIGAAAVAAIEAGVDEVLKEAVEFARTSEVPDVAQAREYVYA